MIPAGSSGKTARFEARITEERKALLSGAAELTGRSLTGFVVASAQETAVRALREHEAMILSARDREIFVAASWRRRRRLCAKRCADIRNGISTASMPGENPLVTTVCFSFSENSCSTKDME